MRRFATLLTELDRTTSTLDKQAALVRYLQQAPAGDAAWAVALLSGRRPKKPVTSRELRAAACRFLGCADWVVEESYALVGDFGETLALLIDTLRPPASVPTESASLATWMEARLPAFAAASEAERYEQLAAWWAMLPMHEAFVLHKLMAGGFRVGASEALVVKALAAAYEVPQPLIAERLTGKWVPTPEFYATLTAKSDGTGDSATPQSPGQPYPFALAYPLAEAPEELGPVGDWQIEWKWDGIRAQIVRRGGACHIWSRGEDLVTGAFPELAAAALAAVPDGSVLDGEILAFGEAAPLPFAALQKRLGVKRVTPGVQAKTPVRFLAYDLLEDAGRDLRGEAMEARRARLEELLAAAPATLGLSPLLHPESWTAAADLRAGSRGRGVEGLMLKRRSAPYRAGRRRGDTWKWKVEPLTVDAVLIYAQAGSGKRANLFTDYTFAVWHDGGLVPVAKAYSGLDQAEILELDRWIRAHTRERFGPVRSVEPAHVFELGFEGIQASTRHKAGVALRFPRILRWRKDKPLAEADTLAALKGLLDVR